MPPGTSKWNRIEHRLFSFITQNWRGKPLVSYQTIVQAIGATTTRTGLQVQCAIDDARYPAGVKVSDAEMADLKLTPHEFHGEWNYTIGPSVATLIAAVIVQQALNCLRFHAVRGWRAAIQGTGSPFPPVEFPVTVRPTAPPTRGSSYEFISSSVRTRAPSLRYAAHRR